MILKTTSSLATMAMIGGKYGAPVYKFVIESGRKYHKIVMEVPNDNRPPLAVFMLL